MSKWIARNSTAGMSAKQQQNYVDVMRHAEQIERPSTRSLGERQDPRFFQVGRSTLRDAAYGKAVASAKPAEGKGAAAASGKGAGAFASVSGVSL